MKLIPLAALTALATCASVAQAATLTTTVTANGSYGSKLSVINDGVFPPDGTFYNEPTSVYFGDGFGTPVASFNFDLGGVHGVGGIVANVDNNDDYSFIFYDGATVVETYVYPASAGTVSYGLQNFSTLAAGTSSPDTPAFAPVDATNVVVNASAGDGLYGIGEVEFSAAVSAAPEPSTWALMFAGVGLMGAALRLSRKRGNRAAQAA